MSLELDEWVSVWFWLRFVREPRVMDALPQQEFYAPLPEPMGADVYERYHDEWLEAGGRKTSPAEVVRVMSGANPLLALAPNPLLD